MAFSPRRPLALLSNVVYSSHSMRELRIVNKFSGNLEMRMRVDGADTRHESVPRLSRGSPVDPLFSMRSDDGAAACSGVMRLTNRDMELLRERSEEHTSELQSRENLVCR